MRPSEATTLVQKIAQLLKDKLELYQEIDLTHNNLLINIINDVVAGRFSTMEPSMICMYRNSVPEKQKTRISSS